MTMRKRRSKPFWQKINREWLPEIIVLIIFLIATVYFLLFYFFPSALLQDFQAAISSANDLLKWYLDIKKIIAILIAIAFIYFLLQRLRYHVLRTVKFEKSCPTCQHKIHKKRRKFYQYLVSFLIPIRPYYCRNCSWTGWRAYDKKHKKGQK